MCFTSVFISTYPVVLIYSLLWFYISDGTKSEVVLYHPDEIIWFQSMDDTHHPLNKGREGGDELPQPNIYPDRIQSSRFEYSHHGMLYHKPVGSDSYNLHLWLKGIKFGKFDIEPCWVDGLRTVTGKFGRDKKLLWHSSVVVRQKIFVDESLFWICVVTIVLNTYPSDLRTIEREYRTGQLLKIPVFSKLTVVL